MRSWKAVVLWSSILSLLRSTPRWRTRCSRTTAATKRLPNSRSSGLSAHRYSERATANVLGRNAGALCFVVKEDGTFTRPNDGICDSEAVHTRWEQKGWLSKDAKSLSVHPANQ